MNSEYTMNMLRMKIAQSSNNNCRHCYLYRVCKGKQSSTDKQV